MKRTCLAFFLITLAVSAANVYGQNKTDATIADSLYKIKDYKGAIDNYNIAINAGQQDKVKLSLLLDNRALAELGLKLFKEAIADETTAIAANPNLGSTYWNRGVAYNNIGEFQQAANDYTKAILYYKDKPKSLSTLYNNRGSVNRKLKNYKNAIDDHTQALALNPQKFGAYWERALAYNLNGDYQLASDDYTTAMFYHQEDTKELGKLYDNRGVNRRALKQYKEAINDFNMALKLNPENPSVNWHRGITYQRNGDYELAANDYTAAMRFYQNDKVNLAILYDNRAGNELDLRQPEKAINDITTAIALDPTRGHLYWSRASIYSQTGESRLAIEDYTKAMDFYKDKKESLAALHDDIATNLYILNENQKVIEECAAAIALNPKYGPPYFLLGKVYLKRLVNKEQAINNFNKAIELDTTKSSVSYIFSQLYIGQTDLAMKLLQQRVLNTPNPDDVLTHYYNIACVFSIMNKPEEANIYLKKAIDSGYSKKFAANDEDFDNIRKTPDYIATMANNNTAK